jgi:hypothetical protein
MQQNLLSEGRQAGRQAHSTLQLAKLLEFQNNSCLQNYL